MSSRSLRRGYRGRSRNGKFAATAIVAGVLLAAAHGHGGATAAPAAAVSAGGGNEGLANAMAAAAPYDWTGGQTTCLDELWTRESGFDDEAANPTSDARGNAQNISGWSSGYQPGNASQQVAWGLSYIAGRYGTPCAAWDHEQSANWY